MQSLNPNTVINSFYWRKLFYLLVALLFLFVLYFSYASYWQTSALKEIIAIQNSKDSEAAKQWTPLQKQESTNRLVYLQKGLSAETKKDLDNLNARVALNRVEKQFEKILAMNSTEKNQELDKMIDQTEKEKLNQAIANAKQSKLGKTVPSKDQGFKLDNQGLSNLLDLTTPELRAKFHMIVQEVNRRRQERNLPAWRPFD